MSFAFAMIAASVVGVLGWVIKPKETSSLHQRSANLHLTLAAVSVTLLAGLCTHFVFWVNLGPIVSGYACTQDAQLLYGDTCPFVGLEALSSAEYIPERIWTPRSILHIELALLILLMCLAFTATSVAAAHLPNHEHTPVPLLHEGKSMLTEIGTLVAIIKGLVDITKGGSDLFGKRQKGTIESVEKLRERIEGLAEQLRQSVVLSKMLPLWLKDYAQIDLYTGNLSDVDVKHLDMKIRDLIRDSIHDHFSGTLFRTSFSCLPGIENSMKGFRERLLALEQQIDGILPGDADAWRRTWPVLKVRMDDLRKEAVKITNTADAAHGDLLKELSDAAVVR